MRLCLWIYLMIVFRFMCNEYTSHTIYENTFKNILYYLLSFETTQM